LTGETIVLTLGTNGQDIERLEAAGEVKLTEVDRITIGDQLTYVAAKEEYTVIGKGKLVRMFKRDDDGNCRRSDGSSLIFSRGAENLELRGREDSRTQTAADNACPAPPKR